MSRYVGIFAILSLILPSVLCEGLVFVENESFIIRKFVVFKVQQSNVEWITRVLRRVQIVLQMYSSTVRSNVFVICAICMCICCRRDTQPIVNQFHAREKKQHRLSTSWSALAKLSRNLQKLRCLRTGITYLLQSAVGCVTVLCCSVVFMLLNWLCCYMFWNFAI